MTDVVDLAHEAEEIRTALALKKDDPRVRLAQIERTLQQHWDEQHRRREEAEAEFRRILAEYEPARDAADEALSALVAKVSHAVDLRRRLEHARKRAGVAAPEKTSIRASRDRAYRELRQNARLAAGQEF